MGFSEDGDAPAASSLAAGELPSAGVSAAVSSADHQARHRQRGQRARFPARRAGRARAPALTRHLLALAAVALRRPFVFRRRLLRRIVLGKCRRSVCRRQRGCQQRADRRASDLRERRALLARIDIVLNMFGGVEKTCETHGGTFRSALRVGINTRNSKKGATFQRVN